MSNLLNRQDIITPQIAAKLIPGLVAVYNADYLTVISGVVVKAEDLTGRNNHAVQATAGNRLAFFPNDPGFDDRSSFGSTTNVGSMRLETPSILARHQFFSIHYKNGGASTFSQYNYFSGGPMASGGKRTIGLNATANLYTATDTYTTTAYKNGVPTGSTLLLPMPASIVRFDGNTTQTYSILGSFGTSGQTDRVWIGGCRTVVFAERVLSKFYIQFLEGVLAWDSGIQYRLAYNHPYRTSPPRLSCLRSNLFMSFAAAGLALPSTPAVFNDTARQILEVPPDPQILAGRVVRRDGIPDPPAIVENFNGITRLVFEQPPDPQILSGRIVRRDGIPDPPAVPDKFARRILESPPDPQILSGRIVRRNGAPNPPDNFNDIARRILESPPDPQILSGRIVRRNGAPNPPDNFNDIARRILESPPDPQILAGRVVRRNGIPNPPAVVDNFNDIARFVLESPPNPQVLAGRIVRRNGIPNPSAIVDNFNDIARWTREFPPNPQILSGRVVRREGVSNNIYLLSISDAFVMSDVPTRQIVSRGNTIFYGTNS